MISNKKAKLLIRARDDLDEDAFTEHVVWVVPAPMRGSAHTFKSRIACIESSVCVIRHDNEAGKGDHRHVGSREFPCQFGGLAKLFDDFDRDIADWRKRNENDHD